MVGFAALLGLVCAALGALASLLYGRAAAAARAKRVHMNMGRADDAIAEGSDAGVRTLRGTLEVDGGPGPVTRLPYGMALMEQATPEAHTAPHGALAIDVGGRKVAVEGDVQVILGSVEAPHRATSDEASVFEVRGEGVLRSLRHGDRVRARGRLSPVAAESGSSYRERALAYCLRPEGGTVPLAYEGVPRVRGVLRHAQMAIGVGAIGASAAFAGAYGRPPAKAAPPVPLAPAASDDCARSIERAIERGDPEGADVAACPDTEQAALAQFYAGLVEGASRSFAAARAARPDMVPSIAEAEAHLFAGDAAHARAAVQKLAEGTAAGSARAQSLGCVAAALGRRAGEPDAAALLDRLVAAGPESDGCASTAYDFHLAWPRLHAYGGRYGARADLFALERSGEPGAYADLRDHPTFAGRPEVWVVDPGSAVIGEPIGLVASALAAYTKKKDDAEWWLDEREAIASYAVYLAMFFAYMGERAQASAHLGPVDALAAMAKGAPSRRAEYRHYLFGVAAAAALHAGDDARTDAYLALVENGAGAGAIESYRRLMRPDASYEKTLDHWNAPLLRTRETGDGAALALELEKEHSTGRRVLARVLPGVTRNRSALSSWLRDQFPPLCVRCGLWAVAANVADRRDAARLLGDEEIETRAARTAARLEQLIYRRDGAPQWMALEQALAAKD